MRKLNRTIIAFFLLIATAKGFSQNDCIDAIIICGDANLSNLKTNGFGVQEIDPLNACSSQENNSIWIKIKIRTGGTFGFILTPESDALVVDFDFWVFGPNVNCTNIGTAVRCSTTNPLNAGLNYNITGMNNVENDVSEGPGQDGNGFIKWMTVNDNDTYYIAIDRPIGESNFSIAWTGTATFYEQPLAQPIANRHACQNETLPEGMAIFDLTPDAATTMGNQVQVAATFFTNYDDAVNGINAIADIAAFQNTNNPQKLVVSVLNTITGCFDSIQYNLYVDPLTNTETEFSYTTPLCVKGRDSLPVLGPGFSPGGIFNATPQGLSIDAMTGKINLAKSIPGNFTVTYSVGPAIPVCYASESGRFAIEIENCEIPKGISPNGDGLNDFFDIEHFDVKELSIFNRYGTKVYHRKNYKKEWNGETDKGKELPDATYYYVIELNNGESRTGWVYLNRQQ